MQVISPNTRISDLIKANEECIAAIASLSKPLKKLSNPLLRKLLASRVTLSEAAKMGKCSLQDFKKVLEPLGFSLALDEEESKYKSNQVAAAQRPDWLEGASFTLLDVRPTIEQGTDPLREIQSAYTQLATGDILCIWNSFVPSPLIRLLEKQGAQSHTEQEDTNSYFTYFRKGQNIQAQPTRSSTDTTIETLGPENFQKLLSSYGPAAIIQLDVRDLPMPQPMQSILEALPKLNQDKVLYIRHHRVPLHLLEEMEHYSFRVKLCGFADSDIRLLIYKP